MHQKKKHTHTHSLRTSVSSKYFLTPQLHYNANRCRKMSDKVNICVHIKIHVYVTQLMFPVFPRSFYRGIFDFCYFFLAQLPFQVFLLWWWCMHTHTHTLTRVHQIIIPHVFYYMVFVNLACEESAELTYNIVESIVIFQLTYQQMHFFVLKTH